MPAKPDHLVGLGIEPLPNTHTTNARADHRQCRTTAAAGPHRHSVSQLYAHLVFVTTYRPKVFNDAMLTDSPTHRLTDSPTHRLTNNTLQQVCNVLRAALVEFNGDPDHVHLLVRYPPALAISTLVRRLKGATARRMRQNQTGRSSRARMHRHLWTPSNFAVSVRGASLSIIKQHIDQQARPR
jgi:putative transposase